MLVRQKIIGKEKLSKVYICPKITTTDFLAQHFLYQHICSSNIFCGHKKSKQVILAKKIPLTKCIQFWFCFHNQTMSPQKIALRKTKQKNTEKILEYYFFC